MCQAIHEQLGNRPVAAIRMLTHVRTFGYNFNPVTFYYAFDPAGALAAVVAEITNTPWGERHAYVLDPRAASRTADVYRWRFAKNFHVSPFLPMDLTYDWAFSVPTARLGVQMTLTRSEGSPVFDATLRMIRNEITAGRLRGLLIRYPLMTVQVIARIYGEALRLWLKRAPVFSHPARPHSAAPARKQSSGALT